MILIDDQVALCKVARRFPVERLLHDYQRHEPTGMLDTELVLEMGGPRGRANGEPHDGAIQH
jgi:hypothetical protein